MEGQNVDLVLDKHFVELSLDEFVTHKHLQEVVAPYYLLLTLNVDIWQLISPFVRIFIVGCLSLNTIGLWRGIPYNNKVVELSQINDGDRTKQILKILLIIFYLVIPFWYIGSSSSTIVPFLAPCINAVIPEITF